MRDACACGVSHRACTPFYSRITTLSIARSHKKQGKIHLNNVNGQIKY